MAVSFTIPSIYTAVDKYSRPVKKMERANKSFARSSDVALSRAERGFRKLGSPIRKVNSLLGGFGGAIGGAVVIGAVGNAISVFKDFEQANATLSSVMADATGPQLKALQDDAKRLGATTAKSATEVVSLQEAFARLGFTAPEIINMTEATISGSIAMNSNLAETAELTGAMVRTFDDFSSVDAPKIIDRLTISTQKSALNFEKLQTSLPIVAGAANSAGIPFNRLLALLGKLSDAGIDASSSSTALRNIFLESAKQGLSYDQILEKIVKSQDQLTAANDEFGKRAAVSASILAKNIGATAELESKISNVGNAAQEAADKQLNTLNGALTILQSSWEGFILSVDDGSGSFGQLLTKIVKVTSEILSLASGSAKAESTLNEAQLAIRKTAKRLIFLGKTIGITIGVILAARAAIFAIRTAMIAWNTIVGISTVLQGKSLIALRANAVAMKAAAVTTKIVTAAQWLWNAAMSANPIGLIIIGIAALIGIVALIIKKWDEWGAAITLVTGIIGAFFSPVVAGFALVISLVQSFRKNWDLIKEAFKTGGIVAGLKAIGVTILDAILAPLQQLLELASKIPGVGKFAEKAAGSIGQFRGNLNEGIRAGLPAQSAPTVERSIEPEQPVSAINPELSRQETLRETINTTTQRQNVAIDINDNTGNASVQSDNDLIDVKLTSTSGF